MLKWLHKRSGSYKATFNSHEGREVLVDLRRECGADRDNFSKAGGDATRLAYLEGQRSVYLYIKRQVDVDDRELDALAASIQQQRQQNI